MYLAAVPARAVDLFAVVAIPRARQRVPDWEGAAAGLHPTRARAARCAGPIYDGDDAGRGGGGGGGGRRGNTPPPPHHHTTRIRPTPLEIQDWRVRRARRKAFVYGMSRSSISARRVRTSRRSTRLSAESGLGRGDGRLKAGHLACPLCPRKYGEAEICPLATAPAAAAPVEATPRPHDARQVRRRTHS